MQETDLSYSILHKGAPASTRTPIVDASNSLFGRKVFLIILHGLVEIKIVFAH